MRIGVDASCWQNNRGYGRHARALLTSLVYLDRDNQYTLIVDSPGLIESLPEPCEPRLLRPSMPAAMAASANGRRSVADMWHMSRALSDKRFDVLLYPTIYSYVPAFSRARKLVVIHDVIPETFPQLTLPRPTARFFWKAKSALGRWQADAVITVSEYSRCALLKCFPLPEDRVFVVGEAPDPVFRRLENPKPSPRLASLGIDSTRRVVVYVGGFSPHKGLDTLVTAFSQTASKKPFDDLLLVLVGEYEKEVFHSYYGAIRSQVDRLGLNDRVIFTGYLPDEELVTLLNLSTVLALPSQMEGFGLPAIEAAACGCPVVATTASPLPELLGEGGLYVEPQRPDELMYTLQTILESPDLRGSMRVAGLAAAGRLTWNAAALQMMNVIRTVTTS